MRGTLRLDAAQLLMKKGKYQTKQAYVDAALSLIKKEGVEKLSMRKVADKLNVSHMAVYKHFSNKEALLAATLDEFVTRASIIPDDALPWDEWTTAIAHAMYDTLCSEMSWIPILGTFNVGPHAVQVTTAFLAKLTAAGFTLQEALNAYLTMIHLIIGAVTIEASLKRGGVTVADTFASQVMDVSAPAENSNQFLLTLMQQRQLSISLPILIKSLKDLLASKEACPPN